jgi:hypothetical protein
VFVVSFDVSYDTQREYYLTHMRIITAVYTRTHTSSIAFTVASRSGALESPKPVATAGKILLSTSVALRLGANDSKFCVQCEAITHTHTRARARARIAHTCNSVMRSERSLALKYCTTIGAILLSYSTGGKCFAIFNYIEHVHQPHDRAICHRHTHQCS